MEAQTDLNLFKEKAAAVQVVVTEVADLPAAFAYAVDLTTQQGGRESGRVRLGGPGPGSPGGGLPPGGPEPGGG